MRLGRVLLSEFKYFKRYMEREMLRDRVRTTWKPIAGWKVIGKPAKWHYDEHRPFTDNFRQNNAEGRNKKPVPVLPIKEWDIFKGDRVEILVGRDKGKHGLVNMVVKERNWVFIEGLNCEHRVEKSNYGGLPTCSRVELPLLVPNQVRLVDPSDEKPCDVDWRYTEEGELVRVSIRSGRIIPVPSQAAETEDFVFPKTFKETSKDAKETEALEVTYKPNLMTFEQEIMEALGIKEHRKRAKKYWY